MVATAGPELFNTVGEVIRQRRSNMNVDQERPVPPEVVDQLIELATWAPNHYRTNPFRFVVLNGAARERLGQVAADAIAKVSEVKDTLVERQRVQFLRTPTVLAVASAPDP